jgi:hypothetical protein
VPAQVEEAEKIVGAVGERGVEPGGTGGRGHAGSGGAARVDGVRLWKS